MSNSKPAQKSSRAQSGTKASNCLTALEVIEAIKRWENNQNSEYQRRKKFIEVFDVCEDTFRSLNTDIIESFEKPDKHDVEVIVRYSDSMSEVYSSLDGFLKRGGSHGIPESVILTWRGILPDGDKAGCQIRFETKQGLQIDIVNSAMTIQNSEIEVSLQCHKREWINNVFNSISCTIAQKRVGGIYTLFLIFRSMIVVLVCSLCIFILAMAGIMKLSTPFFKDPRSKEIEEIKSVQPMEEKFNKFLDTIYLNKPDLMDPFIPVFLGIILGGALCFVSMFLLPKLVPQSCIAIGLSKTQIFMHKATYKYFILMIISPFVVGLIWKLIMKFLNFD